MAKKSLLKERIVYKPFEYPEAFDFYMKQQQILGMLMNMIEKH